MGETREQCELLYRAQDFKPVRKGPLPPVWFSCVDFRLLKSDLGILAPGHGAASVQLFHPQAPGAAAAPKGDCTVLQPGIMDKFGCTLGSFWPEESAHGSCRNLWHQSGPGFHPDGAGKPR